MTDLIDPLGAPPALSEADLDALAANLVQIIRTGAGVKAGHLVDYVRAETRPFPRDIRTYISYLLICAAQALEPPGT